MRRFFEEESDNGRSHRPVINLRKRKQTNYILPEDSPSGASTASLYAVSSSSGDSDSDEVVESGKKYYLEYFVGPGENEWHLDENSTQWVVSKVDISEICLQYRAEAIASCESAAVVLSASQELALSHVFVFREEDPHGIREYFDDELWEDIFAEIQSLYPYPPIPERDYKMFSSVVKIACENSSHRDRQTAARQCLREFETTTGEEKTMEEILRNLIDNEQSSFTRNYTVEDTHIHYNVAPIVKPFFRSKKTFVDWENKMSESSAIAKRRFDQVLIGTKPDLTVRTTNPKKHVELLVGEIKPPNTRDALVAEDLVCLGRTMKNALDKSIEDGVEDLVVCGLQVDGFLGRGYVMDLLFDGIYRMILLGEFELPAGATSWGTILGCYQVLSAIKNIVDTNATRYQSAIRQIRQDTTQTKAKRAKMTKTMFHSPMKVPKP